MSIKGIDNLAALMEDVPETGKQEIPLSLIDPDPQQPRTKFDESRLQTLAESVKAQGIIEPLIVSLHPDVSGRYMLVAGERRWRAAGLADLDQVPVVVREFTAEQRLAVQLVENIDREELSVLEESAAIDRLIKFGHKPKGVAAMLGKGAAWVSLRRKIAANVSILESFVDEGLTKDVETLAMLVDLKKVDARAFSHMHQEERLTRASVRDALDQAKQRKREPLSAEKPSVSTSNQRPEIPKQGNSSTDPTAEQPERQPVDGASLQDVPDTPPSQPTIKSKASLSETVAPADEGLAESYAEIQGLLQTALGLPVNILAPSEGRPGELQIEFADRIELEALRQSLT